MIIYLIITAAIIQAVAGLIGMWHFAYEFKCSKENYEESIGDGYMQSKSGAEKYAHKMKKESAITKKFALGFVTSPFAVIIIPLAVIGLVLYGAAAGFKFFVPAITYSPKD